MSSRVIFVSLFLGLAAGMQSIDVQTDSAVTSLRILLAGSEVAALTQRPWHAVVDFGRQLDPRAVEAIGYDERGNEIGRATQIINLPHAAAELAIVLQSGGIGPKAADLRWQHLQFKEPKSATLSLDRIQLKLDKNFHARFPETDWKHPHLIAAEMKFRDGIVARREIVVGGAVADTAQSELTPVLLMQTAREHVAAFEDCLLADGRPVRTAAVEKPSALVIFVRDPDPTEAVRAVDPTHQMTGSYFSRNAVLHSVALDNDTAMRYLWPIPKKFADAERHRAALLFEPSPDMNASAFGLIWFLTRSYNERDYDEPLQLADAVAVAGLRAIAESRRRAVVLITGKRQDSSGYDPRVVRRYLADIGVPLFVWSLTGPRSEDVWGEVADVSSLNGLRAAADKLRENLAAQRIAWVDVDPLSALRLSADPQCGMATVARPGM
jgi:hypothetical protein